MLIIAVACSMFTAASASIVYLSFGGIPFDYGMVTFLVGLIFTMIGQVRSTTRSVAALPSSLHSTGDSSWRSCLIANLLTE